MRRVLFSAVCATALLCTACPKDDAPEPAKDGADKGDEKPADKPEGEEDDAGSLQVAEGDGGVDGPVPPEASMVFFTVEGALNPLACFDKDKKTIESGKACLSMVKPGDDVRVASHDSQYNKKAGELVEPQCMAGSGKKVAIGVDGITEGADFLYGTWPPSGIKIVNEVDPKSTEPRARRLDEDQQAQILKAIQSDWKGAKGEVLAHQVAEVHATSDKDKIYSVFIPHPTLPEQYLWSGAFLAEGGDLGKMTLLEKSKTKKDVFEVRGWMDLDGDGKNELWMRLVFEEGSGDRMAKLTGGKVSPLGKWSCGAAR